MVLRLAVLAPLLRTFEKSTVNLHFGLTFFIQGHCCGLANSLAYVDEHLERALAAWLGLVGVPYVLLLDSQCVPHDFL